MVVCSLICTAVAKRQTRRRRLPGGHERWGRHDFLFSEPELFLSSEPSRGAFCEQPATCSVSYLACFWQSPSAKMLKAAVPVFRYFKWAIENDAEGRRYEARQQDRTPTGFNCRVGKNQVCGYVDSIYMSEEQTLCALPIRSEFLRQYRTSILAYQEPHKKSTIYF